MKHHTRDNIIDVAKTIFQIQGYHATGINQIIKESGVPKGSLYYHFPNGKEEIAIAAVESIMNSVKEEMLHILETHHNPVDALKAQFTHVARTLQDENRIEFRIGLIAAESASVSDGIREACKKAYSEWISMNQNYLIEKGYAEEEAEKTAILINILIEGAMTMSITYQDLRYFHMLADQIQDILS